MNLKKIDLAATANCLTILAAVACLCYIGYGVYVTAQRQPLPHRKPAATRIKNGDSLKSFIAQLSGKDRILFLALSTHCDFCAAEIPFYRKIQAEYPQVALIGLFSDNEKAVEQYLDGKGFHPAVRASINFASVGLAATPTVLLSDTEGRVMQVWEGRLSPEAQQELMLKLR